MRPSTTVTRTADADVPGTCGGLLPVPTARGGRRVALAAPGAGGWSTTTHAALAAAAQRLARTLAERLPAGATLALLTEPRPEWMTVFLGCVQAGVTLLPLEPKLTAAELRDVVRDAQPGLLVCSERCAAQGAEIAGALPAGTPVASLDALLGAAAEPLAARRPHPADTALLVYTSGTSGRPKGVRVGRPALVHQVRALSRVMELGPRTVLLSMLPVSHMFGITGGLLGVLHAGGEACFAQSALPDDLAGALRARRATHLVTVPLFLRLLKARVEAGAAARGPARARLFAGLLRLGGRLPGGAPRRLLFRGLRRSLGGALTTFVSGGAPIDAAVEDFFTRTGLFVLQGYGLTETGPVVAVNTPRFRRAGSVGRPLPGVELRLADDGEILTRGPHVMQGYHRRPDLTREAIDREGFFHTGDLGRVDAGGYLYVTGRRKSLIVLASGQKVQPEEVEEALQRHDAIAEACVLPRPVAGGLLAGTAAVWAVVVPRSAGEDDMRVAAAVRDACRDLSPWKRPQRVVVSPTPLPRTVTLKVQRERVAAWLEAQQREQPLPEAS